MHYRKRQVIVDIPFRVYNALLGQQNETMMTIIDIPVRRAILGCVLNAALICHWPAGEHVSWETGIPDGKPETSAGKHTHCSAFAAAAAKRVGIYLLRPPEHPQILLANAQYDWLASDGPAHGWKRIADEIEAQHYANEGWFVLAAYKNHHDDKPGHIAIVRPADKSPRQLREEGPQVTQAGGTNYRSVDLRRGFAGHPAAWEYHEVVYYARAVDAAELSSAMVRSGSGRNR